jgi:hypothetical protein
MKAIIKPSGGSYILTLVPENNDDRNDLRDFGSETMRAHIINCRGFVYLQPEVEFLVQPYTGDDRD